MTWTPCLTIYRIARSRSFNLIRAQNRCSIRILIVATLVDRIGFGQGIQGMFGTGRTTYRMSGRIEPTG